MNTNDWNKSLFADYDATPAPSSTRRDADGKVTYTLRTRRYSHWMLDENGEMVFLAPNKLAVRDDWYAFDLEFSNRNTAYVIMDPWSDMACDFLNEHLCGITQETVVPMAQAAARSGHPVIILTGLPNRPYNSKITPELQQMVDSGTAEIVYHEHYTTESFTELMLSRGIENLVYSGFFTNMCTLLRPLGIVHMNAAGKVKTYFIPQAAAAMEHGSTWETNSVNHASTLLIAQTQAPLIELDDVLNALK